MENTFYVTRRFPCGHSAVYEHPAIVLRKMTRANLVPRDQEFAQITVHLGTSDGCSTCPPSRTPLTARDMADINQHGINHQQTTKSLLKHTFCCEHDMRRPMHESVVAKLQKHEVVPSDSTGAIVLEVESSYCEGCQESKMREVHESLRSLQQRDPDPDPAKISNGNDNEKSLLLLRNQRRRRQQQEDELRDVFRQLEEAQLTAELAPRHFRGALRIFADICAAAIEPPERRQAWVHTLTTNDYMVADVQKAIEETQERREQNTSPCVRRRE